MPKVKAARRSRLLYLLALLVALSPFQALLRVSFPDSAVVLLWRDVVAYGLLAAVLVRAAFRPQPIPLHWLAIVIIEFIGWGLFVILLSDNLALGVYGFRTVVRYAPLFFVTLFLVREERDIRTLTRATLFGALVLTLVGVYQFIDPFGDVWVWLTEAGVVPQPLRFGMRPIFGFWVPRIDSLYVGGVDGFAIFTVSVLAVALYARRTTPKGTMRRAWFTLVAFAMTFVAVFTMSRMALVGLAVVGLVALRSGRRTNPLGRWMLAAAALAPLVYLSLFPEPGHPRFVEELITRTVYQIRQYPTDPRLLLIGYGYFFNGLAAGVPDAFTARSLETIGSGAMDSQWLWAVLQFGAIGAALYMLVLAGFILTAYQVARRYHRYPALAAPKGLIWHPRPLLAMFLVLAITSFHSASINYHGIDVNFYVLGAITVWYWKHARPARRPATAPPADSSPLPKAS